MLQANDKDLRKDIEAEITFLSKEAGGKTVPVYSGFRPLFFVDGENWDAVHSYPDVGQVNPGDTVRVFYLVSLPRKDFQ